MKRRRLLLVAAAVVVLAAYVVYLLFAAGELRGLAYHDGDACRRVTAIPGPEDAVAWDGGVIVSSQDRAAHLRGGAAHGTLYYVSLTDPAAPPVDLLPGAPADFHPHGIGLFAGARPTLFVVNHPGGDLHGDLPGRRPAHTIEVYDVAPGPSLTHRRTISDERLLVTPNDVAPVSDEAFYVTNDHGSGDPLRRKLEDFLRMSGSHVLFYDGRAFRRLPGTYGYANGIALSPDGRRVYVAAPTDRSVYVLDRDPATNDLAEAARIFLGTGPDNITVDAGGDLWIGAHPKLLTLSRYLRAGEGTSPSQVLRVRVGRDGTAVIEELLLTDGRDLSASTVAVPYGGRYLVGGVFGPGLLDCAPR